MKKEKKILLQENKILKTPFNDDYIDEAFEAAVSKNGSNRKYSPEMASLIMQDMLNRKSEKVAPDTSGVDYFFVSGFICEEMRYDFASIEQDFLKHCSYKLQEYHEEGCDGDTDFRIDSPMHAVQKRILRLIYNGAKLEDAYCTALIQYLYKTYHKREYNQLKRFRRISPQEVMALAEDQMGWDTCEAMGRILGMCSFMNIGLDDRCSILFLMLEQERNTRIQEDEEDTDYIEFADGLFEDCLAQVDHWEEACESVHNPRKKHSVYWDENDFIGACFRNRGYSNDYMYSCMENYMGLRLQLARTLAVLKTQFPNREYTFEEVQHFTQIYSLAAALTDTAENFNYELGYLTGNSVSEYDLEDSLFKPEKVILSKKDSRKDPKTKAISHVAQTNRESAGEEDYIQEISALRKKVHEKEQENSFLRDQYKQEKVLHEELEKMVKKYEQERDELISLREYVYKSEQDQMPLEENDIAELKKEIMNRKIVIIGGHINWANKLKSQFPNWLFIHPDAYRAVDGKILEGKEKVYFFTDYLNHISYIKYIAAVREHKIPFGYLGSRNVDTIIRQISEDMKKLD